MFCCIKISAFFTIRIVGMEVERNTRLRFLGPLRLINDHDVQALASLHIMIIDEAERAWKPQPGIPLESHTQRGDGEEGMLLMQQNIDTPVAVDEPFVAASRRQNRPQLERHFQRTIGMAPTLAYKIMRLQYAELPAQAHAQAFSVTEITTSTRVLRFFTLHPRLRERRGMTPGNSFGRNRSQALLLSGQDVALPPDARKAEIFAPGVRLRLFQFVMALLRLEFEAVGAFGMDDGSGADEFLADHRSLGGPHTGRPDSLGQLYPIARDDEGPALSPLISVLAGLRANIKFATEG